MSDDAYFRMVVEDIFFIRGRGTVVTGVISQGVLNVGDVVRMHGSEYEKQVKVMSIEIFRRRTKSASAGERVGVVLQGINKDEITRGDVLASSHLEFDDVWWEV